MEKKAFIPRQTKVLGVLHALGSARPGIWLVRICRGLLRLAHCQGDLHRGFRSWWAVGALAGVTCGIGMATGRYGNLQEKPWRERQVRKNS